MVVYLLRNVWLTFLRVKLIPPDSSMVDKAPSPQIEHWYHWLAALLKHSGL